MRHYKAPSRAPLRTAVRHLLIDALKASGYSEFSAARVAAKCATASKFREVRRG